MEKNFSSVSLKWIENLAVEELNMEESGIIDFNSHLNPEVQLEQSSIELMEDIRELFEIYLTKFNQFRAAHQSSKAIKIFKISNTINDFILFRNSLKLIVSRKTSDVISIGFMSNAGVYGARTNQYSTINETVHEIKASMGPFNKIYWQFQGENIDIDALVKHYLAEFIRLSAQ